MRNFIRKFRVCILLSVIVLPVSGAFAQSSVNNQLSSIDQLEAQAAAKTQEAADLADSIKAAEDSIALLKAQITALEASKVYKPDKCSGTEKFFYPNKCKRIELERAAADEINSQIEADIARINAEIGKVGGEITGYTKAQREAQEEAARLEQMRDEARTALIGQLDEDRGFFTPKTAELSITLLSRIFGTVGNVLQGGGNQLLGTLISLFNAAWVVAIGIGVLWIVWSSVIAAAGSGELMSKGKKTVFNIIRIVIGFSLVVPSATTGYSLAQVGVMWIAVQGVGMAGNISDRFHEYLQQGGAVVPAKPPAVSGDLEKILPMNLTVLQAEICMYKLQDIMADENRKDQQFKDDTAEFVDGIAPSQPAANANVGYSLNDDNTITFGTRKDDGSYNSECGKITFNTNFTGYVDEKIVGKNLEAIDAAEEKFGYRAASFNLQDEIRAEAEKRADEAMARLGGNLFLGDLLEPHIGFQAQYEQLVRERAVELEMARQEDERIWAQIEESLGDDFYIWEGQQSVGSADELLMLQQLATTEVILQMQPIARSIASLDDISGLEENDPDGVLDSIRAQGSKSMAGATMVFATIFDPVRAATIDDEDEDRIQRMKEFKEFGWLYTPIAMLDSARSTFDVKISDYQPGVAGPNIDEINTIGDRTKEIQEAVDLTASGYQTLATAYLYEMNKYSNIGNVSFQTTSSGEELRVEDPLDYLNFNVGSGVTKAANEVCGIGLKYIRKGAKFLGI
jgi:outer membrane murein-binding lipoprotein Lpp